MLVERENSSGEFNGRLPLPQPYELAAARVVNPTQLELRKQTTSFDCVATLGIFR